REEDEAILARHLRGGDVNRRAKLTPDRRPILTPFVGHKRGAPDRVKLVGVAQPGRARMIGLFGFSFESGS
ncbi:MAG: hypothetical protein KF723_23800, partial [Rhizobiaceae bacterium]|nr:hypothetical protein [Rhizobiaceae bacterium]